MRYAALDLSAGLPHVRPDSSRAYAYTRSAHLAAIGREASKTLASTAAAPACGRTEYLRGFVVREELRRRGLLARPAGRRRVSALAA
jgi:hypothetical protein